MFNVQELNVIMHRTYSPKLLIPNSVKEKKWLWLNSWPFLSNERTLRTKKKNTHGIDNKRCARNQPQRPLLLVWVCAYFMVKLFYWQQSKCTHVFVQSQSFAFFCLNMLYLVWRPSQRWPSLSVCLRRIYVMYSLRGCCFDCHTSFQYCYWAWLWLSSTVWNSQLKKQTKNDRRKKKRRKRMKNQDGTAIIIHIYEHRRTYIIIITIIIYMRKMCEKKNRNRDWTRRTKCV